MGLKTPQSLFGLLCLLIRSQEKNCLPCEWRLIVSILSIVAKVLAKLESSERWSGA